MANKQVVFTDRIVGISIQNGLVRLDLAVVSGQAKGKDGKPAVKMDITHQVVLPVDGFLAGFNIQQKLVKELATRQQKKNSAKAPAEKPAAA
jgi:hypothetical protein